MIEPELQTLLERTLSPSVGIAVRMGRPCKLCNHPSHHFDYVDFSKSCNDYPLGRSGILIEYFRCQRCELMFTDFFNSWSAEDFSTFIYNQDYIKVDPEYEIVRPRHSAEELAPSLQGAEHVRLLDYGSGSGAFAREMGKLGFASIESYDPFSHPVAPSGNFDIITCFDVIEHSTDPQRTLSEIMRYLADGGCLLVGQTLQPADITTIRGDWWYVAPRNGHVTFYSSETMHLYAEANGLRFTDFGDLFALTGQNRSELTDAIIARRHPQIRRAILGAPAPDSGRYSGWHEAEPTPQGAFRWTRESDVSLGTHPTPVGEFRVILRYNGAISPDFLQGCSIRAATHESPMLVYEDMLYALFDFPDAGMRDISIHQPPMQSPASLGNGNDRRPLGLAISCA
jgi:SAM-dependent methyltransferase